MTTRIQPYQGSYLTPGLRRHVADAMRTGVLSCPPDVRPTSSLA